MDTNILTIQAPEILDKRTAIDSLIEDLENQYQRIECALQDNIKIAHGPKEIIQAYMEEYVTQKSLSISPIKYSLENCNYVWLAGILLEAKNLEIMAARQKVKDIIVKDNIVLRNKKEIITNTLKHLKEILKSS
jgi:hypothetical protein